MIKRIRPLEERRALDVWYVSKLPPGSNVQEHLNSFLPKADCVLIWISPDLWNKGELYSLFIRNITHIAPHTIIIPVLARHAVWEGDAFLKTYQSNLIPFDRQPMPTDSMERSDAWLTATANAIAIELGILSKKRSKKNTFWIKWNFWAWFIPVIIGMVALFFAYPSFVADSRENNKYAKQKTKTISLAPECGFPVHFDSTQLFILITRFEDNLNKENETGCYGRGIARRIDEIKNRDNLPIKICYQDSLSPTLSDDAERLRGFYHADIIVWGNLQNDSNCESDGFCLKFQPSDTLKLYAGGKITAKVDNEYQPNISAMDLEAGLINMGRESFDAWLLGISNLKIGRKKPEFYRISPDWPVEKQAEEYGKRANMFFQLGVLEKTIQDYNEAIKLKPSFIFYYKRGIALAKTGQDENAVMDFNKAILFNPNDANVYYNRGKSNFFLNRLQESNRDFSKVSQIDPNFASLYNFLSVIESNSGNFREAIVHLNKCIRINPKNVDYYIARSANYEKSGLNKEAITDLYSVLHIDPHYYKAYDLLGALKFELGQYNEAIFDLNIYIEHDTTSAGVYFVRGTCKSYLGKHKEAISDFNKAIYLSPKAPGIYEGRGNAKYEVGQYHEAIADLDQSINLDSSRANAFANRGVYKSTLGLYKEAILDFDKAIQLDPKVAYTYDHRGIAKNSLGQYKEAIADFDKVVQLDPNGAYAYNHRGIAKNGLDQYEAAIADFNKAVQIQSNIFIHLDRGIAKSKLGKYNEAIADFNIAIRNKPENADCYYNRGVAYWNKGNYFSAMSDFWSAFRLQYLPGWLIITVLVLTGLLFFLRYRNPNKSPVKKMSQTEKPAVNNITPTSKKRRKK